MKGKKIETQTRDRENDQENEASKVKWLLTEEDKQFLRSCNIDPR